jgi:hypothetical protein
MQQEAIAKQLHCHDILMLMNIELIHKLGKNNVVRDILSQNQGEMLGGPLKSFTPCLWVKMENKEGVCERPPCTTLFYGVV